MQDGLDWCAREDVRRAIFSHCGSAIVAGDEAAVIQRVREHGASLGIEVSAEGVGRRTTAAVVSILFALILLDAVFTVLFGALGL